MPPPPRKPRWSRPLADLVGPVLDSVLARQGFSESDLILHWDDIVGERLAATSRPVKLQWPPRGAGQARAPEPATLVVRVESGFALEFQHMADQVLARINAHLGWRCVGRLAFRQGPIEARVTLDRRRPAPTPEATAAAERIVADLADEGLRDALVRLGARVTAAGRNPTS